MKTTASLAIALAALAAPAAAQTQGPGWNRGWGGHMYDGGWMWWGPFHGILSLLLLAAVVVGVVFLIRWLWHGPAAQPPTRGSRKEALELLDLRYARGEIDREDYLQRKKDLMRGGD